MSQLSSFLRKWNFGHLCTEVEFLNSEELILIKSSPLPAQLPRPGRSQLHSTLQPHEWFINLASVQSTYRTLYCLSMAGSCSKLFTLTLYSNLFLKTYTRNIFLNFVFHSIGQIQFLLKLQPCSCAYIYLDKNNKRHK